MLDKRFSRVFLHVIHNSYKVQNQPFPQHRLFERIEYEPEIINLPHIRDPIIRRTDRTHIRLIVLLHVA